MTGPDFESTLRELAGITAKDSSPLTSDEQDELSRLKTTSLEYMTGGDVNRYNWLVIKAYSSQQPVASG